MLYLNKLANGKCSEHEWKTGFVFLRVLSNGSVNSVIIISITDEIKKIKSGLAGCSVYIGTPALSKNKFQ